MSKGAKTQGAILQQALDLSSEIGLEGLSIGTLAKRVGMSKSGLYAHFQSKEELQCQVLDTAADRFSLAVARPAVGRPRGVPRVRAIFELWLDWSTSGFKGGCPLVSAATEFDDREGPVRDRLVFHFRSMLDFIARAVRIAVEEGHFRDDLDVDQFAFELWGTLLAYHHYCRLMHRRDARDLAQRTCEDLIRKAEHGAAAPAG